MQIQIESGGVMKVSCCFLCPVHFNLNEIGFIFNDRKTPEPKFINQDVAFMDQLREEQDLVQLVLKHVMKCCEDREGFDIY